MLKIASITAFENSSLSNSITNLINEINKCEGEIIGQPIIRKTTKTTKAAYTDSEGNLVDISTEELEICILYKTSMR